MWNFCAATFVLPSFLTRTRSVANFRVQKNIRFAFSWGRYCKTFCPFNAVVKCRIMSTWGFFISAWYNSSNDTNWSKYTLGVVVVVTNGPAHVHSTPVTRVRILLTSKSFSDLLFEKTKTNYTNLLSAVEIFHQNFAIELMTKW